MAPLDEIRQAEREVEAARVEFEKAFGAFRQRLPGDRVFEDADRPWRILQAKREVLKVANARRSAGEAIHAQRQPAVAEACGEDGP